MGDLYGLPFEEQQRILREEYEKAHPLPVRKRARLDIRGELGLDNPALPCRPAHDEMDTAPDPGSTQTSNREDFNQATLISSQRNEAAQSLHSHKDEASVSGSSFVIPKEHASNVLSAGSPESPKIKQASTARSPFVIPKRQGYNIPTAYSDGRRRSNAAPVEGNIIPKSLQQSKNENESASGSGAGEYKFTEKLEVPGWLREVKSGQHSIGRDTEARLQQIKTTASNCLRDRDDPDKLNAGFDKIRDDLHVYEYVLVDEKILKKTRLLEIQGLPQFFLPRKDGFEFPYDIKADARALHHKWCRRDFDPDIMRGLVTKKNPGKEGKQGRFSTSLDTDYESRVSWKYFGPGDLVSGQWWPILLACMRDGAHGSSEAGISRLRNDGACSVLISGAHYDDRDEGDTVHYCGTEGKENRLSEDTKALHDNIRTGNVVRVIRSAKLPAENRLRPELGFRYDGVYKVVSHEVLDAKKPHHRFLLHREPDQDPIRWTGIGARPTIQDKEAYKNHRTLSGM